MLTDHELIDLVRKDITQLEGMSQEAGELTNEATGQVRVLVDKLERARKRQSCRRQTRADIDKLIALRSAAIERMLELTDEHAKAGEEASCHERMVVQLKAEIDCYKSQDETEAIVRAREMIAQRMRDQINNHIELAALAHSDQFLANQEIQKERKHLDQLRVEFGERRQAYEARLEAARERPPMPMEQQASQDTPTPAGPA